MSINVQFLINNGPQISRMAEPSPELFPAPSSLDHAIAELSFLTSRREYWEAFVCLNGFSQQRGTDPHRLLLELPLRQYLIGQPWEENPFFSYCSQFELGPRKGFVAGALTLQLVFDERHPFAFTLASIDKFQECLMRCTKDNNTDYGCVLTCMRTSAERKRG